MRWTPAPAVELDKEEANPFHFTVTRNPLFDLNNLVFYGTTLFGSPNLFHVRPLFVGWLYWMDCLQRLESTHGCLPSHYIANSIATMWNLETGYSFFALLLTAYRGDHYNLSTHAVDS